MHVFFFHGTVTKRTSYDNPVRNLVILAHMLTVTTFLKMRKLINFRLKPQRSRWRERYKKNITLRIKTTLFHFISMLLDLYAFNFLYQFHVIISCLINIATTPVRVIFWSPFHIFVSQRHFSLQFCALPPTVSFSTFIIPPRPFHEFSPHHKPLSPYVLLVNPSQFPRQYLPLQIYSHTTAAVTNPH